jgi:TctA family transporter
LRQLAVVAGAIAGFALTVERFGVVPAIAVLVAIHRARAPPARPGRASGPRRHAIDHGGGDLSGTPRRPLPHLCLAVSMNAFGDLLSNIAIGLETALTLSNLFYCFLGVFLGTVLGIIPGIGTLASLSLLFPITFHLEPTAALVMLAGIFYGTTYARNTASILLNVPGTPANAVVCLDGYPMAQQGRGGVALLMTTVASFVGGSIGIILMMLFSPLIAESALLFGSWEYFSLMLLGLVAASAISVGSPLKGLAMVVAGAALGIIGLDLNTATPRFVFGVTQFFDGISLVAVAMGLFGVSEVIATAWNTRHGKQGGKAVGSSYKSMIPTRDDVRRSWMPMLPARRSAPSSAPCRAPAG